MAAAGDLWFFNLRKEPIDLLQRIDQFLMWEWLPALIIAAGCRSHKNHCKGGREGIKAISSQV